MTKRQRYRSIPITFIRSLFLGGVFLSLAVSGCKTSGHTSDSRLRQIDEMLDSQLSQGTPKSRVIFFLSSQNFAVESARDARTVVAIVHRVDTDTLQPATARVTFHFDDADKLKSYDLEPAPSSAQQP
jgi:hypothetical protein